MKFIALGVMFVIMAFFLHVMFIMFDYVYNDPDEGVFPKLQDTLNDSWSASTQTDMNARYQRYKDFFGIARVGIIGLAIVCFLLEVVKRPKIEG